MENFSWIRDVDFRISSGLIYWLILLLFGQQETRRERFALRLALSCALLCGVSWLLRFSIDEWLLTTWAEAGGQGLHTVCMAAVFFLTEGICYQQNMSDRVFVSIAGFVTFKLAWYAVKATSFFLIACGLVVWDIGGALQSVLSYIIYSVFVVICALLYRHFVRSRCALSPAMLGGIGGIILLCHVLLEWCMRISELETEGRFVFYLAGTVYCAFDFALVLLLHRAACQRQSNEELRSFIKGKEQYYRVSRDGLFSLQIKCHDLKHQIARIRSAAEQQQFDQYLQELENSINEYGTVVQTGNEAMDVVLTEKNILCLSSGIKFSYIVDGGAFSFMEATELYALLGNALDNAIESSRQLPDAQKRIISLKGGRQPGGVLLHIENYVKKPPEVENGLPRTTKHDAEAHGFGMRSMQQTVQKYGGTLTFQTEGDLFKLNILIPA